ncbi:unnamed protein product [marine sediment metagenome]|uniref:Uncharacterized protein n=1 Tax=marine sediment metagenome TaxID=412755 RepID=X0UFF0_9ZZZZ
MVDNVIKLVRPCVTGLLTGALVYFTGIGLIKPEVFVPIASIAIVWWYKDREAAKARKALEKLNTEKK